jgi:tRNA threonylcarbamoyl adenosine modification protein YeaZ
VLLLVVDTATEACIAAVCRVRPPGETVDGRADADAGADVTVLASRAPIDARRHGELLAPLITQVLDEAGVGTGDLDGVVAGVGPGPFTSLRVGVVTAASVAHALGLRAVGVCSLDAIPDADASQDVVVVTDARRREVYWARYRDGARTEGPDVARPADLLARLGGDEVVVGSAAHLTPELAERALPDLPRYPRPGALAQLARAAMLAAEPPGPLVPLYLRRPDATPPAAARPPETVPPTGATL